MVDMECNLESPFKEAFENGDSIDYKLVEGAKKTDHTFVKELGYESKMHSDCSYSALGLPGLSLSSYGDWGTIFVDWADDNVKKIFLDMCNEEIITPWRVRTYIREGKDVTTYDYDERGWTKHDKQLGKWVSTKSPYTK
jgi:hypothetical protein